MSKKYSIECYIPYESAGGFAKLIPMGCDAIKRGGFKPRFLKFIGANISLNLDYGTIYDLNEFNPKKIESIELGIQDDIEGRLKDLSDSIIKYFLSPTFIEPSFSLTMYPKEKERTYSLGSLSSHSKHIWLLTDEGDSSQKEFFMNFLKKIGIPGIKFEKESTREIGGLDKVMDDVDVKYKRLKRIDLNLVSSIYKFLLDSNIPFEFSLDNPVREEYLSKGLVFSDLPGIKISTKSYITLEKELIEFEQFLSNMQKDVVFNKIIYDREYLRQHEKSMRILVEKVGDSNPREISGEVMDFLKQKYSKIHKDRNQEEIRSLIELDLLHIEMERDWAESKKKYGIIESKMKIKKPEKRKTSFPEFM